MNPDLKEIIDRVERDFQKYPITCFSIIHNMEISFKYDKEIKQAIYKLKQNIMSQKEIM